MTCDQTEENQVRVTCIVLDAMSDQIQINCDRSRAATLPRNASASPDLFATAEGVGAVPDQVSALALCRGDANASTCLAFLTQAFRHLCRGWPRSVSRCRAAGGHMLLAAVVLCWLNLLGLQAQNY
ncbi:hypothetical protein E2562_003836 [Oryza meyeriana var. granulata]|uniref:Gnk2-homologous domain-containing protein n=1 Tax=Oryza meyeriana var. granulata TaxID=110450 RepID=A0A6G1CYM4_9ORYZ|nr:hypothetical protein E2562_003836 [Oryza meyeriana var. granulata]